ncbi:hypothetical protein [Reichenbachiella sp. MALMAid0571]|uniref:hypothetical protein n=1 Tax=Reichenbachiella sp. MALMAid0571 TaxID=3143939 RepID=UPI0032DEC000
MKKSIFTIILALLIVQISYSQKDKKKSNNSISDPIEIKLDNVAFDEDSYMSILDSENKAIAYFDRFENKSCAVKSAKLFNLDNELIYVLVPLISNQGFEIHLKDANNVRGYIKTIAKPGGFKLIYDSDISYFLKPYDFEISTEIGIGKVSVSEYVKYEGINVMAYKTSASATSGVKVTPFITSKMFYLENKLDAANWALILQLISELSFESSKVKKY